jgi:ketosteroid isomerase-like protein
VIGQDETERNRSTIADAFEAWRDGTAPITDAFAPDMTWRIEGHSAASRAYADKTEFIDEVLAPFGRRFSTGDPFRPIKIRGVYADGDTVIVLWDGRGTTIDDTIYENSYAWFMRLKDDKVVCGTAFYDSISFNTLWTQVTPAGPLDVS